MLCLRLPALLQSSQLKYQIRDGSNFVRHDCSMAMGSSEKITHNNEQL